MSGKINLVLVTLLVMCSLSLVNAQYQARHLFIELERSTTERLELYQHGSGYRMHVEEPAEPLISGSREGEALQQGRHREHEHLRHRQRGGAVRGVRIERIAELSRREAQDEQGEHGAQRR